MKQKYSIIYLLTQSGYVDWEKNCEKLRVTETVWYAKKESVLEFDNCVDWGNKKQWYVSSHVIGSLVGRVGALTKGGRLK